MRYDRGRVGRKECIYIRWLRRGGARGRLEKGARSRREEEVNMSGVVVQEEKKTDLQEGIGGIHLGEKYEEHERKGKEKDKERYE
ncbi:Protein CBG25320 [Caenorhabditis briggsae]|uniref:Protein CBG25320 n=1 Tax=Caenorhabditis briggsae TaxID=6238 RepID=B6IH18_CAEBR|nr:Protein CBG25320 [Caenorhabditis briggsae]CAR99198.1 Protein CBG25320 [Caenorhabditis briggsae]